MLSRALLYSVAAPDPGWVQRVVGVQEPQSPQASRGSWLCQVLKLS